MPAPERHAGYTTRFYRPDELRVVNADSKRPMIVGYAAVFNQLSQDLGGFREFIRPGAFSKTIKDGDCRALIDHQSNLVLGRAKAGTLRMIEDEKGLRVEIDPPDTSYARDLFENMAIGNVDGMSFGFVTITDEWSTKEEQTVRELVDCHLFDVSVVTYPAYLQTKASLRSRQEAEAAYAEYRSRCAAQLYPARRAVDGELALLEIAERNARPRQRSRSRR